MHPISRFSTPSVAAIYAIALASTLALAVGTAATAGGPPSAKLPDIPQSYLLTPAGVMKRLGSRVTYSASELPVALRITPPDASWWGAQWKSGDEYFRGGGPPNYGWVHIAYSTTPIGVPKGLITIMTAYAQTPSVPATLDVLLTRGRGAVYEPASPVKLGGFSGMEFDGRVVGKKNFDHTGHYFIPFSPPSHAAKYYADEYPVYGDVFRVIALDVRGKTVIVFIENGALPESEFPRFLSRAESILDTLRFPADRKVG